MTIYVIDKLRPLPPTHDNYDHALDLLDGDVVILSQDASIEAYGYGAYGIYGGLGTTLLIDGDITSLATAIWTNGTINVGASASVTGEWVGIWLTGDSSGGRTNVLTNAGSIRGGEGGVAIGGAHAVISNTGTIEGGRVGIDGFYSTEKLVIHNTGTIKGPDAAIAGATYGQTMIRNQGYIKGDIFVGDDNDVYDGRGGTIDGDINLGWGDDIAYGGDGSETFFGDKGHNVIDGGGGVDTLKFSIGAYQAGVEIRIDLRSTEAQQVSSTGDIWYTVRNVENLIGNSDDDRFIGNDVANMFVGAAGHDLLDGQGGNDILNGGKGNDTLIGGEGTDVAIFSGKFSDYAINIDQNGMIAVVDLRGSSDGLDRLSGIEFAIFSDTIFTLPATSTTPPATPSSPVLPTVASTTPSTPTPSPAKNLSFRGGKKAETFEGDSGHDYLNGGLGNDTLTGREGQDTFAFSTKLGAKNVDQITDFQHADDSIKLSKAVFGKIQKGMLSKDAFHIGSKAHDKSDRIIYNEKTGALSYDADGSGTKYAAVKFAQLKAKTLLQADDFFVV